LCTCTYQILPSFLYLPFAQSDHFFEVFLSHGLHDLVLFYFIFPFHHGQEKEYDLGITPNQLSIRNCEDR
jgi:hypothetical protein